jgi:dTDP-4-dehydrorhamnose reductase
MAAGRADEVTLVVGSDSLIGAALVAKLRATGRRVVGTTRREGSVDASTLHLDLSGNPAEWSCPWPVSVAVLCAGVTSIDMCRQQPDATARVNVDGISALAKNLLAQGTFVVYLSTNQVFDGSEPNRRPDEPTSPVTEYGRQKAEAEDRIGRAGGSTSIVRLTKVLYPDTPLLSRWRSALEHGETVQPFSDMHMAPVPLDWVVAVLILVCERRQAGMLHLSGDHDVSYAEAAFTGARMLGVDEALVRPVRSRDVSSTAEPPPGHTTLSTDRLESTLGIKPPDVQETIEMAFGTSRIYPAPVRRS